MTKEPQTRRVIAALVIGLLTLPAALALPLPSLPGLPARAYLDASVGLPVGAGGDSGWTGIHFGDFNADGWPDLAAVGRKLDGPRVFCGGGDGAWTACGQGIQQGQMGRSDLRFGDVNGDGKLDLVTSDGAVYFGHGDGTWESAPSLPFGGEDVALGDFDNDGALDAVVVGHVCCGVHAFHNDGAGRWTESSAGLPAGPEGGHKAAFADFNRDGCLDIVASFWYDGGVWFGDCRGHWSDHSAGLTGFQGHGVAAGDVNGDMLPDVAFGDYHTYGGGARGIRVFLNDGAGGWKAQPVLLGESGWGGLAMDDVDGDGRLDIAAGTNCFSGCAESEVALLIGDGAGNFTAAPTTIPPAMEYHEGLDVADIDHNGVLDFGVPYYGSAGVHVWRDATAPLLASVRVLEPRGGEHWVPGGVRTIRWDAAMLPGTGPGSVDLAYSTSGPDGPWAPIATGSADSGSYAWRVPGAATSEAFLRVTLNTGLGSASATNAAAFAIAPAGAIGGP